jgi:hypothetical protein
LRATSAEFPVALANHLPMVLVAMHRMGASPVRLEEYAERYRVQHGLVPVPPSVQPINAADWTRHFGGRTFEADYRAFFHGEVARLGAQGAIAAYLPTLLPGIAGSALHPLMRLAYGVMRGDSDEIAVALGYWACTYLPLGLASGAAPITRNPGEVLLRVRDLDGIGEIDRDMDHLWHFMRAVSQRPSFAPVVDWLAIDETSLPDLASASLALFAATMDFCALHALTGCHWIRLLQPVMADQRPLMRYFWQAVASVYPKIGSPDLPGAAQLDAWRGERVPAWPDIMQAACASEDEHDLSLTFSAYEEFRLTGDPLYRVVAARRVGMA